MSRIPKEPGKLVTVPSPNKIPERDIDKSPILECQHLGIDFGGLTAVAGVEYADGSVIHSYHSFFLFRI